MLTAVEAVRALHSDLEDIVRAAARHLSGEVLWYFDGDVAGIVYYAAETSTYYVVDADECRELLELIAASHQDAHAEWYAGSMPDGEGETAEEAIEDSGFDVTRDEQAAPEYSPPPGAPPDLDTRRDYKVSINGRLVGWMRGNFVDASASISVAHAEDGDGTWRSTGRKVADYDQNPWVAAPDLWRTAIGCGRRDQGGLSRSTRRAQSASRRTRTRHAAACSSARCRCPSRCTSPRIDGSTTDTRMPATRPSPSWRRPRIPPYDKSRGPLCVPLTPATRVEVESMPSSLNLNAKMSRGHRLRSLGI